ncbi:MAG: SRPBCC domain-containing protein [Candidatus Ranarchaeia archaeon]
MLFAFAIKISASQKEVFEFVSDYDKLKKTVPNNIKISPIGSPIAEVGGKSKWELTTKEGKVIAWEEVYTKVVPNELLAFSKVDKPEEFEGGFTLYGAHKGTLLVLWEKMKNSPNPSHHEEVMKSQLEKIKQFLE